ncbi:DsbA family protein [Nocardia stercoris]|uniref:DsbA family protein n=1 Tax=Nocardia stercoris TaxID=2483361 RepID=UPI001F3D832B|nr:thioredoxin domain-containing protein [Nocardia stercoris]
MNKKPANRAGVVAAARGGSSRRGTVVQIAVAAVLIALIVAIGISVGLHKSDKTGDALPDTNAAVIVPTVVAPASSGVVGTIGADGSITIGKPDAKVQVRVVADPQCPVCQRFEAANAQVLADEVNAGTAVVQYDIISFLDRASSGTMYSTRAANAAYCTAAADPSKFLGWLASIYEQQPPENGTGLKNAELTRIAAEAGYTDPAVAACITGYPYAPLVAKHTTAVLGSGIQSTPTVFVNGQPITAGALFTQSGLRPAIEAAAR